ncbi:hypothetical protein PIB30_100801 [Stylosanthes scabra]|uniref:Uncharacterized protein n=1 Tax=Stylosanthes scabra TaxID=79078 RepID=A0ABU6QY44_9FABA|nr:hypothetical protein [Stylosanthes scabra]
MSEGERIEDALERLSKIFNSLSMLGRTYSEQDIGEKDKKFKKKQKAYISWENEDDSSTDSDDEEVANICLMANEEKVSDLELCEDDLQETYDNLLEEFIKISQDFTTTKKLNAKLQKENDVLKNENTKLGKIKINPNDNVPCESCEKHIHE